MNLEQPRNLIVTDFDGTLTRRDFYDLVHRELLPPETPNHYADYRAGKITHFECLARFFSAIRCEESAVLELLERTELEPRLGELIPRLALGGWGVEVASAGCEWYIHKVLKRGEVTLPVHANRGYWAGGDRGLVFELPTGSPYCSKEAGIDKAAVVSAAQSRYDNVAFAGDGFTDVAAALLVPPEFRFARADCARVLREKGQSFIPFEYWSEVAETVLKSTQ